MIFRPGTVDGIAPLYSQYLKQMSRFYDIKNYDSWHAKALKNLKKYTHQKDHHIYILKESDRIIGFALINAHLRFNAKGVGVAEFYIQKEHQGQGCGRRLAEYIFSRFQTDWEVAVALENRAARLFWHQVISSFTGHRFQQKKTDSFKGYGFVFDNS